MDNKVKREIMFLLKLVHTYKYFPTKRSLTSILNMLFKRFGKQKNITQSKQLKNLTKQIIKNARSNIDTPYIHIDTPYIHIRNEPDFIFH